jgi:thiosulfate/3-mercaptopyruvate sulfurtransferase
VSVAWLAAHLRDDNLVILDASMPLGAMRIPGARPFDFDRTICDRASPLPHMMPSAEVFANEVSALGIDNSSAVVVYDSRGVYSSPRARWMFRAMGHDRVAVLDGGLPAWVAAGHAVEGAAGGPPVPRTFVARPRDGMFCDADFVARALNDPHSVVVDARSAGRFHGREPEPRPGLRPGHIPGSLNLPYADVLLNGHFRPITELTAIMGQKARADQQLVFTCGSGVTACIPALAAEMLGFTAISVYDGSWSEWGLPSPRPVATS